MKEEKEDGQTEIERENELSCLLPLDIMGTCAAVVVSCNRDLK